VRLATVMSGPDPADELPIACTLGAGDFETRQAELSALGRRSLISIEHPAGSPVVLAFRRDAATKAELERIAAAEAECCGFLKLTITAGESLELTIEGPDDAGAVIEDLVGAFNAEVAA
jgi:phosphotransferase system HPr-like phosphotransfer protein